MLTEKRTPYTPFRGIIFSCGILVFLFLAVVAAGAMNILHVGDFSDTAVGKLPENWEPLTFKNISAHTRYSVVLDNNTPVVKAVSDASASGLIRKIKIDPKKYPIIKWRWKITNIYKKGDVTKKSGDDFPARVYIAFEYDPDKASFFQRAKFKAIKLLYGQYPPSAAITYVWANKIPVGTIVANPYTDDVQMIAVESGTAKAGTWVSEERNVYQDYIKSFGKKPPMISGIAIMTDSDNTGEKAVSYYGDITMETK